MIVAIVGAECTGKTTLAAALTASLVDDGLDAVLVPEHLRSWCDAHSRTPRRDEQRDVARAQMHAIHEAAARHALVVADTTALMTAAYSDWVFGDATLYAQSIEAHRALRDITTLLTALDLPWRADGLQRDGPQVRAPVDAMLRSALLRGQLSYAVVCGTGPARLAAARRALPRDVSDRFL